MCYKMFYRCIVIAFLILFSSAGAFAKTLKVESLTNFSTDSPADFIKLKLVEPVIVDDYSLSSGDVLDAVVFNISSPKRLKRDAGFSVVISTYTDRNGVIHTFEKSYKGKYAEPIDKKEITKEAALSVGNVFVKGLSIGVSAVEGAIKNEDGNRLKSSAKSVYENSPLSLVENGEELHIKVGDYFYIKVETHKDKAHNNKDTED